jgi:hypothetical protein
LDSEEISRQELKILTSQAKDDALKLHAASMLPKVPSPPPAVTTSCSATGNAPPPQVPQDPILPPGKIESSLKTGKFHPVFTSTPTPHQTELINADPDNKEDDLDMRWNTFNYCLIHQNKLQDQRPTTNFFCLFL